MEPPAKRARLGRAPHDLLPPASGDDAGDDDDEDEIAMDPEDYAMKQNPQYRLDRSRAVADSRLKSAFELLFEKYSKDFGDTGDEINFYTDEIEVDNGHIASLPVAKEPPSRRPARKAQGGGQEDDEDEGEDEVAVGARPPPVARRHTASWSLQATGFLTGGGSPHLGSLLSPQVGSMGHHSPTIGSGTPAGSAEAPVLKSDPVDPTWAAPEIPDAAFTTPGSSALVVQRPRLTYSVPNRTIFRKPLPDMYGKGAGHDGGNDGEDDDLILDTSEPALNVKNIGGTPRRRVSIQPESMSKVAPKGGELASAQKPKKPRRKSQPAASSPAARKSGSEKGPPTARSFVPDSMSPEPITSDIRSPPAAVLSLAEGSSPPRTTFIFALIGSPSPAPDSLPTPPDDHGGSVKTDEGGAKPDDPASSSKPAASGIEQKAAETFSRNALDPSFVFSDDEDFGLKKRKKPPGPAAETPNLNGTSGANPASAGVISPPVPAAAVVKKRGPGRPRKIRDGSEPSKENSKPKAPRQRVRKSKEELAVPEPSPDKTSSQPATQSQPAGPSTPQSKQKQKPRRPQPQQPSPAKVARLEIPDSQSYSSSLVSLVSDDSGDSGDEAGAADVSPKLPVVPGSAPPRLSLSVRRALSPSSRQSTPSTETRKHRYATSPAAGRSRSGTPSSARKAAAPAPTPSKQQHSYARARLPSASYSSPLAHRQLALAADAPSPSGSLVQTPGGTMRRCGQDGFRCEREFCFKCT